MATVAIPFRQALVESEKDKLDQRVDPAKAALADLRVRIHALERGWAVPGGTAAQKPADGSANCLEEAGRPGPDHPRNQPCAAPPSGKVDRVPWTWGDRTLDDWLPAKALDTTALHEIKPASYNDWPAALALGLRLVARRIADWPAERAPPRILWCQTSALGRELGRLYGPGIETLGLPLDSFLIVETGRIKEALWAMEEGLRSGTLALVVGGVKEIELTASRRLGLAAAAGATPCLALTAPTTAGAPATTTRWRATRCPSATHAFDRAAPGAPRIRLALERCRGRPLVETLSETVEWCDAARRFRVASGVADRAPRESGARLRSA
jgi:protein ImuA